MQLYGCILACQVAKSKVEEVFFHTFLFDLFSLARLLSLREFFTLLAAARLCSCLKSRAIYVKNFSECLLSWIRNGFACWKSSKSCIFHRKTTTYGDCRNVYASLLVVSSRALVSRFLLLQLLRPYVVFKSEESATESTTPTCTVATQHRNHFHAPGILEQQTYRIRKNPGTSNLKLPSQTGPSR